MIKKKIIVFSNIERDPGFIMAQRVCDMLREKGRETRLCPMIYEDEPFDVTTLGFETSVLEDELPCSELVITIGGDGTILRAARSAAVLGIPVLGINMGNKGFMAELEENDISLIDQVADGNYKIEHRMMLDTEVNRNDEIIYKDFALNDIVIKGDNKVIDISLFGDGQQIMQFSGDGAVVATPTGSTAYSMAAGGPIVEPSTHNIIVTPICAHVLEAKSIVLASDRHVTVEIGYIKHNPAYMSVDGGQHISILSGDIVNISQSKMITKLVRITDRSFYQKVNEKLVTEPERIPRHIMRR